MLQVCVTFLLHHYSKLATNFTFDLEISVILQSLKCLPWITTRKLRVKIVIPKVQSLTLLVTTKLLCWEVVLYPLPQFLQENPKLIWIIILPKKHSAQKPDVNFTCKLSYQDFPSFYALRTHKNTHNGFLINTTKVERDKTLNKNDDGNLKVELRSC